MNILAYQIKFILQKQYRIERKKFFYETLTDAKDAWNNRFSK